MWLKFLLYLLTPAAILASSENDLTVLSHQPVWQASLTLQMGESEAAKLVSSLHAKEIVAYGIVESCEATTNMVTVNSVALGRRLSDIARRLADSIYVVFTLTFPTRLYFDRTRLALGIVSKALSFGITVAFPRVTVHGFVQIHQPAWQASLTLQVGDSDATKLVSSPHTKEIVAYGIVESCEATSNMITINSVALSRRLSDTARRSAYSIHVAFTVTFPAGHSNYTYTQQYFNKTRLALGIVSKAVSLGIRVAFPRVTVNDVALIDATGISTTARVIIPNSVVPSTEEPLFNANALGMIVGGLSGFCSMAAFGYVYINAIKWWRENSSPHPMNTVTVVPAEA